MVVSLSFLHSPVTPVGTGLTNQLDWCSSDYTPQDEPVDLSGEANGLNGESCHDLLDCPYKSLWAVTAAHPIRPIHLAGCLGCFRCSGPSASRPTWVT